MKGHCSTRHNNKIREKTYIPQQNLNQPIHTELKRTV